VLHQGRIAERGTFEELKRAGGVFAWLLAEQNRYNLDRGEDQGRRVVARRAPSANGRRPRPSHVAALRVAAMQAPAGGRGLDEDGPPTAPWSIRIPEGPDAILPDDRAGPGPDEVFSRHHDGRAR
jgi:hypothetical protein